MRVQRKILSRPLAAVLFLAAALNLSAQGTAIFYQGRLNDSGAPANTNYDMRFAVYDAVTNGNRVSILLTNFAVPVSNGLFSAKLDFGPGVFNGTANGSNDWLDIGVRVVGVANFTTLVPRQPILPVPYALFATSASNLLGRVPSAQFSGAYSNAVTFSNPINIFAGTFSGSGLGLTNLNASNISSGTLADARLSANVPLLNASQTFTGANTFSGASSFSSEGVAGTATFSGGSTFNGPITSTAANSFTGVNTMTNLGNTFYGSFFGNGLVGWIATNSTSFTAQFDHGYLLTSAQLVTVTLPTSISVGDIVRVAGGGGGGWLVKVGSGQTIIGTFASFANCTLSQLATSDYYDVAASADGVRMFLVGNNIAGVDGSSDQGRNFPQLGVLAGAYASLACSANGKIVYAAPTSGTIRKWTDASQTWTDTSISSGAVSIGCTADGATLITGNVTCSGNGLYRARVSSGNVQISINGGAYNNTATQPAAGVTSLGASSDCTKLVAAVTNGLLYASANQGATWTALTVTSQAWSGAWMSPDGSKFAATVCTSPGNGGLYFCNVSSLPNTVTTISTGSLCGSQGSAVELQYIGGNQFIVVSSTGLLWAN